MKIVPSGMLGGVGSAGSCVASMTIGAAVLELTVNLHLNLK